MQDCKVNILGTEYSIKFGNENDYPSLNGIDGYCDSSTKEIIVDDMKKWKAKLEQRGTFQNIKRIALDMKSFMPLWRNPDYLEILNTNLSELKKPQWIGLQSNLQKSSRYFKNWIFYKAVMT